MDLSRLRVEARMRSPWQALDLGVVMAKAWWKPLFLSWFIPSACLYIVLSLVFYGQNWIAFCLVWWCKPLFDRAPIYIASRALFDVPTSRSEFLRALPKLYAFDCLSWLTWRRFSLSRSYDLPVTILEGLKGKKRKDRLRHLHQGSTNAATGLSLICVHLESLLIFGGLVFISLMIPDNDFARDLEGWLIPQEGVLLWLNTLLSFAAMALVAPFYTMAGFALYLSRRIDLEAWDIEIRFRHLAATQNPQPVKSFSMSCFILGLVFLLLSPGFVLAIEIQNKTDLNEIHLSKMLGENRAVAKKQVLEILEGEDFHKRVMARAWRLKKREAENPEDTVLPEWFIQLIEWLERSEDGTSDLSSGLRALAKGLEFLLWLALFVVAVFLFLRYRKGLDFFTDKPGTKDLLPEGPEVLFALDLRPESLPKDVPAQVQALWQAGDKRPALSLLYRATLSKLIRGWGFVFREANTEGECLAIVKRGGEQHLARYTDELTLHWQALAYGHHVPRTQDFDALLAKWRELFQNEG